MKKIYHTIMMFICGTLRIIPEIIDEIIFRIYYKNRKSSEHFKPVSEKSLRGFLYRIVVYNPKDFLFGRLMKFENGFINIKTFINIESKIMSVK